MTIMKTRIIRNTNKPIDEKSYIKRCKTDPVLKNLIPPCWEPGTPCPNKCAERHYQRVVFNHVELHQEWRGWRMAGKELVSPKGDRLSPRRIQGMIWSQKMDEARQSARVNKTKREQSLVKVVVVQLADWQHKHLGRIA